VEAEKVKATEAAKANVEQDAKVQEEARRRELAQARSELLKTDKISAAGGNSNAQLIVRCQRMPLSIDEVS
jgi:hypothetical protein